MANFIIECSFNDTKKKDEDENQQKRIPDPLSSPSTEDAYEWDLYMDGPAFSERARAGIVLKGPQSFIVNIF